MATAAPLEFLPPRLDARVVAVSRRLLPLWLRLRSRIGTIEVRQVERLVEAMRQFQAGETRLLLAFRHPSLDDPAVLAYLLWNVLPREGRQRGLRWRPAPHAQFLYDRGIPLWAGAGTGWMLSRLGGSSIQRGKLDLPALRTARQLLLNGPHPFAAAPEGATNGHNEGVSNLEPGVAQLAFWTADDLARSGRTERMTLLPIGVQYGDVQPVWAAIEALLGALERDTGLSPDPERSLDPRRLYGRLHGLGERMLALMESFYRDAYHRELVPQAPRLQALLDTALKVVEEPFGIVGKGDLASRCRRVEQASWERLYPSGNGNGAEPPCALQRGLADRLAEETERRLWHMRVVESFVALSGTYVRELPSQERFADTLLLLWDTHSRIRGGNLAARPRLGPRRTLLSIGEPFAVEQRLTAYRSDRRAAVAELTAELQQRLEGLIVPSAVLCGTA
jgi:1-acyl-sn-glycerol-3-phosphate acyltransferase